jgi:hypothetical protein
VVTIAVITVILAAGGLVVAYTQQHIMLRQTELMDEQLELMKRQDQIIERQLATTALECTLVLVNAERANDISPVIYRVIIRNTSTKTADGFFWHLHFDDALRPNLVSSNVRLERAPLESRPGSLFRSFSPARVYPHTTFELFTIHFMPISDATYTYGWRLGAEDFVSPEEGEYNLNTITVTTIAPVST